MRFSLFLICAWSASFVQAGDLPKGATARLGETRFRVEGLANNVALSADGTRIAVAVAGNGDIALLDAVTGRELRRLVVPEEY
jgi:hypothetical protein